MPDDELRDRLSRLESSIRSLRKSIKEAEKEASDDRAFALSHQVATLEARERDLQELLAGRREQIARLETERDALTAMLAKEERRAAEIEERERDLHSEQAGWRTTVERMQAERDSNRAELAELKGRAEELEGKLSEASNAISAGQAQLREAQDARTTLERDYDDLEVRHQRLLERVEGLQSSSSYRFMRRLWRFNAALRRPFRRRGDRAAPERMEAAPESPVPALPAAEERPEREEGTGAEPREQEQRGGTESHDAPARAAGARVDRERERWLARAAEGSLDTRELRVAAVVDEISHACLAPDCDLVTFDSEDWLEPLEGRQPHLLLVESAWQGNGGSWQYQIASYDHPDFTGLPQLRSLVGWCRERGIPTVFWNKEDPVHFERFREAAALFDHVFTTDANCIPAYGELEREGSGDVEALMFAAQPRIHNPIGSLKQRSSSPCFAGAYYRDRHPDRRRSLEMLLDAARPFDLVIYDRTMGSEDEAFGFPERFQDCIRGRLPYAEMLEAYKAHKLFLNANSVTDSPTMFSRRIFELLACDTAVISTEGLGVAETFGELVPIVSTPEEATEALGRLLEDDRYRRDLVVRARRLVLGEHTYAHRLAAVARAAGYPAAAYGDQGAAAMVLVDDAEDARRVRSLVSALSAQRTLPAELLIGLGVQTSVAGDLRELSDAGSDIRLRIVQQDPGASRRQRFRELATLAASPWVAILHPSHEYGEHHLEDLLIGTRFAEADVIGNATFDLTSAGGEVRPELEQRFTDFVHPHSALARRGLIVERGWPDEMPDAWQTLKDWFHDGVRFYSVDGGSFRADPALGVPPEATPAASAEAG